HSAPGQLGPLLRPRVDAPSTPPLIPYSSLRRSLANNCSRYDREIPWRPEMSFRLTGPCWARMARSSMAVTAYRPLEVKRIANPASSLQTVMHYADIRLIQSTLMHNRRQDLPQG